MLNLVKNNLKLLSPSELCTTFEVVYHTISQYNTMFVVVKGQNVKKKKKVSGFVISFAWHYMTIFNIFVG